MSVKLCKELKQYNRQALTSLEKKLDEELFSIVEDMADTAERIANKIHNATKPEPQVIERVREIVRHDDSAAKRCAELTSRIEHLERRREELRKERDQLRDHVRTNILNASALDEAAVEKKVGAILDLMLELLVNHSTKLDVIHSVTHSLYATVARNCPIVDAETNLPRVSEETRARVQACLPRLKHQVVVLRALAKGQIEVQENESIKKVAD